MEAPPIVAEGRLVHFAIPDSGVPAVLNSRFGVPVSVHGHTILLAVDLGADASVLTGPAFDSIRIQSMSAKATRVVTLVRGNGRTPVLDSTADLTITIGDTIRQYWGDLEPAVIDSVRIGTMVETEVAIPFEFGGPFRPFDGLLGRDLLASFDLEFDFPHKTLKLYARYAPSRPGERPRWVPAGVRRENCLPVRMKTGPVPDTTGLDPDDMRKLFSPTERRIWERPQFELPLVINGHQMTGFLDSGSSWTFIDFTAARALGLHPGDSAMRAVDYYGETRYEVDSLDIRFPDRKLLPGVVTVSDSFFVKFDSLGTKPHVALGFQHVLDRTLFFSYSTAMVCVGERRQPAP
jgi:hypothetical protein